MKRQPKQRFYMSVEEVDHLASRLGTEIRKAIAVAGHDARLLPQLQKLETTVANAHVNLHQALGRRNPTLAARETKTLLGCKDQFLQLMQAPTRLKIDLNIDF
ncbi:MAG: hypothetical protein H6581_09505 [Bacteroidia bacterium]|nr:hypothetical protein [Bacteroidia bacterium]